MSLSEKLFDAITQFPTWLASFDALDIPAWAVLLVLAIGAVGLVFAAREFLSWFLKTSTIIDEVIRLETMVRDLQGDIATLESVVEKLQVTAGIQNTMPPSAPASASKPIPTPKLAEPAKAQFRLDN